jgi:UbiD family decarboxylase
MSLRDFLKQMETKKEVLHVKNEVATKFEISAIM